MQALKERLLAYWEALLGEPPDLVEEQAAALPLFLRQRYGIYSARLFDRKFLLALEEEGWQSSPITPAEYGKQRDALGANFWVPVVLVIPTLPSYARNRMVQMGIPFIVPGSQTFIPNAFIDLRETFPRSHAKGRQTLGPAAQCIVLHHLLRGGLSGIPLKEVAGKTRYSPMMATKVKVELEALELCKGIRSGRSMMLDFVETGRRLWERANPFMVSPVKRMEWARWEQPTPPWLLAGMTALSRQTMIADNRLPTYALSPTVFQKLLEKGAVAGCPDAEPAKGRIEIWAYPPGLLSDGPAVDPLSLYLSLKSSADERVQQQLEELMAGIKW
jgi:hypothetical protein